MGCHTLQNYGNIHYGNKGEDSVVSESAEFDPCNSTTHKNVPCAILFVGDIRASQIPVTKGTLDCDRQARRLGAIPIT